MSEIDKNWEIAKQELLNANIIDDLDSYFGKDTWGSHELCDRTHLFLSMWDEHILNHPGAIINKNLYRKAHELFSLIGSFYESCVENDATTQKEEQTEDIEVEIPTIVEQQVPDQEELAANDWDERDHE